MDSPLILSAAIEAALNAYLDLDPDSKTRLAGLQGKIIQLEIKGLGLSLYLVPAAAGLQVLGRCEEPPDTVIRGTVAALTKLSLGEGAREMRAGDVEIEGDTHTGQAMRELLGRVDIDWEELLSKVVGDYAAHNIARGVRGSAEWTRRAGESLRLDTTEYLQEEARYLPSRAEVDYFLDETDRLRSDLDRLEARIKRLRGTLDTPTDDAS